MPKRRTFAALLIKPIKPAQLFGLFSKAVEGKLDKESIQEEKKRRTKSPFDPNMAQKHPVRILLAEDNRVNQLVAVRTLERLGYRPDVANSGREVLKSMDERRYDIIFMDVHMPEMNGLETTRQVRSSERRQPRIVAMTADAMLEQKEACLEAGMDGFVAKPVRWEEMVGELWKCQLEDQTEKEEEEEKDLVGEDVPVEEGLEYRCIDAKALEILKEMIGGKKVHFEEVLDTFLEDAQRNFEAMRLAKEMSDFEEMRRLVHKLVSGSKQFGAVELAELCLELEELTQEEKAREKADEIGGKA